MTTSYVGIIAALIRRNADAVTRNAKLAEEEAAHNHARAAEISAIADAIEAHPDDPEALAAAAAYVGDRYLAKLMTDPDLTEAPELEASE